LQARCQPAGRKYGGEYRSKESEKLVNHVEQVTTHLPYRYQFSVVVSELSDLHQRIQNLREKPPTG
jgi:hypothetical protein